MLAFHLLKTKCSPNGEDTQCAPIPHLTNPVEYIDNHLHINTLGPNNHLFTWKHHKGLHPLTKTEVTNHLKEVVKQYNLTDLKGHSLCIGSTLHYLLQSVPFDVVKTIGQWSSDSFTLCLRHHALILVTPSLRSNVLHSTVHCTPLDLDLAAQPARFPSHPPAHSFGSA